jgi:hypothetical protein
MLWRHRSGDLYAERRPDHSLSDRRGKLPLRRYRDPATATTADL